jgi:hypothetical protein
MPWGTMAFLFLLRCISVWENVGWYSCCNPDITFGKSLYCPEATGRNILMK